jgi:subtilase family serine protease
MRKQREDRRHKRQTGLRLEELETRMVLSVYTPAQIQHAYAVDQVLFNNGAVKGDGSGQTIAIVDAYYDPTIASDMAAFDKKFNLTPLDGKNGDGTFTQLDLSNKTLSPPGDDWTVETALDVEWAHAIAPKANITLVEAASDTQDPTTGEPTDLLNAVQTAATTPGVSVVSMSWGINEVPGETNWDSFFTAPGVTFVAASSDSGAGTIWPSVSPNVLSVGGTTLTLSRSNTIARETGWGYGNWSAYFGGSGGGFSQYESLPSYQSNITTGSNGWRYTTFGARLNPDVAYVADPNTGVAVYDSPDGGWLAVGGTSAGAPQWSALVAIANQGRALNHLAPLSSGQTLSTLYANPNAFHDITRGSTGTYYVVNNYGQLVGVIPVRAGAGYDLVTGLGTPIANLVVAALAGNESTPTTVTLSATTISSGSHSGSSASGASHIARAQESTAGTVSTLTGTPTANNAVPLATGTIAPNMPTGQNKLAPQPVLASAPIVVSSLIAQPPAATLLSSSSSVDNPRGTGKEEWDRENASRLTPVSPTTPEPARVAPERKTTALQLRQAATAAVLTASQRTSSRVQNPDDRTLPEALVEPATMLGTAAMVALALHLEPPTADPSKPLEFRRSILTQ